MEPITRPAVADDAPEIDELVRAHARFEDAPDAVVVTAAELAAHLAAAAPVVQADVVPAAEGSGRRIDGCALWYVTYSTWEGPGIFLDDLFVREEARGRGLGRELLRVLAERAVQRGYRRLDWAVSPWNERALGLYRSVGARHVDDWHSYRLDGEALRAFGGARAGR